MSFQKGDLLICIDNTIRNQDWKGIPPVIGEYYIWRGTLSGGRVSSGKNPSNFGYVEEIISPIHPSSGLEYPHSVGWYKKAEVNVNIEQLLEESKLPQTV